MEKNKLGNASLVLGILAAIGAFVPRLFLDSASSLEGFIGILFGIVFGYVFAYGLGAISIILGLIGVFKKDKKKVTAIIGMVLSVLAIVLPLIIFKASM